MSPALSLYLDLLRFLAAAAVFLAHLASPPLTQGAVWWYPSRFGDAAVTLFFVLSGYVIAHVTRTRERSWQHYATSRLSRLYSVVLVALPLTFAFDALGQALAPDFYAIQKVMWKPPSLTGYLSSFLMLNEWQVFGFQGIAPGSNGPWWSLSFEATYYLLAGLVLFAPRRVWMPACAVVLTLAGPTVLAMLPLWALGFGLYVASQRLRLNAALALALSLAGAALILAYPFVEWRIPSALLGLHLPWGRGPFEREILKDLYVAIAFGLHLLPLPVLLAGRSTGPAKLGAALRWLGSLTFPLYLIHFPLLCLISGVAGLDRSGPGLVALTCLLTLAVVALCTPLCDRLKLRLRALLMPPQSDRRGLALRG